MKRAVAVALEEGVVVTVGARGKPEAALISVEELRRLQHLELERDARLLAEVVRRSGGTVGIEELLMAWGDVHPAGQAHSNEDDASEDCGQEAWIPKCRAAKDSGSIRASTGSPLHS